MHPLRDLGLKGIANPASAYLGVSIGWVFIAAVQTFLQGRSLILPPEAWWPAAASALGLTCYYYGTLAALQRGHLSAYYPIIRSAPLAIILFNWMFFGEAYSALALLGVLMVVFSGLLIQKPSDRLFDDPIALGFALLAMVASAVYSIADSVAMRHVEPSSFLFWVYLFVSLLLGMICLADPRRSAQLRTRLFESWQGSWLRILTASLTSYASYYLILVAFQLRADPAYVSAIRQASIPLSIILAAFVLREQGSLQRLGWAILLAIGIIIVVFQ